MSLQRLFVPLFLLDGELGLDQVLAQLREHADAQLHVREDLVSRVVPARELGADLVEVWRPLGRMRLPPLGDLILALPVEGLNLGLQRSCLVFGLHDAAEGHDKGLVSGSERVVPRALPRHRIPIEDPLLAVDLLGPWLWQGVVQRLREKLEGLWLRLRLDTQSLGERNLVDASRHKYLLLRPKDRRAHGLKLLYRRPANIARTATPNCEEAEAACA
mmetsp:Transcript_147322/g.473340  ORF Transcript_147322/g.473340 Transcript_147322/m.473340 type:complete len:217 (-) Transcript_147322:1-651(-)